MSGRRRTADVNPAARAYAWLTDEDHPEAITCEDLPEEACRAVPRSFLANAANGAATKLAEQLASPGLVMALLLGALGAPVVLVGLLEPVRRGMALVPQLAVSGRIRAVAVRKRFWVAAGLVQAAMLGLMALAAATLHGALAGGAVVAALAAFSLASGVGSVAFSDVIAKTVPQGKRGQLLGLRAAAGGAATILAGLYLHARLVRTDDTTLFVVLLLCAAALWALAAGLFALVAEQPGATEGASSPLAEARRGYREVARVAGFRRYVIARSLLLTVELAVPFYALYARRVAGGRGALGAFLIAVGVGQLAGSPVWGRIADRASSRLVMVAAGTIGALAAALAIVLGRATAQVNPFAFAVVFLLAALAETGIRLGRKAYIADGAPRDRRSFYTATANTATGAVTLGFAVLGLVATVIGVRDIIVVVLVLVLGALGIAAAWWMPEARDLAPGEG